MNGSEIREIRKRYDENLSNTKKIFGCFVGPDDSKISVMEIPVTDMDTEECAMYANLLKKTVSGPAGRHLLDVKFTDEDTREKEEYRTLFVLKDTQLEDQSEREALFDRIIESYNSGGKSYFILLAADTYDVRPSYEEDLDDDEAYSYEYKYFICSICGVKDPKAALRYQKQKDAFRGASTGSILSSPDCGFLFPAFVEKQEDPLTAAYYTKKTDDIHEELIQGVFGTDEKPVTSASNKEMFRQVLHESLGTDLSIDVLASLNTTLAEKFSRDEDDGPPPEIPFSSIAEVLEEKGIAEEKVRNFLETAENSFDGRTQIGSTAVIERNTFSITSTEGEIRVAPENALRLKTKKIDGITYILVPAGADIMVNGLPVSPEA